MSGRAVEVQNPGRPLDGKRGVAKHVGYDENNDPVYSVRFLDGTRATLPYYMLILEEGE